MLDGQSYHSGWAVSQYKLARRALAFTPGKVDMDSKFIIKGFSSGFTIVANKLTSHMQLELSPLPIIKFCYYSVLENTSWFK